MTFSRRYALAGALALIANKSRADTWPSKPVRYIIPYGPGSAADSIARIFADQLSKALGQIFVVDNKSGAGGIIATAEAARAPADGYTILFSAQGTMAFNVGLYKAPGYIPLKDFVFITRTAQASNMLAVSAENPANSIADLVARARSKPEEVTLASPGVGTSNHLCGALLERQANIKIQHVPYRGTPGAIIAVMNNEVDGCFFNTPSIIGQVREGKLKALAVTSKERSELFPKTPTMIEAGYKDFILTAWMGFAAPANTSREIVSRLNAEVNRIGQLPAVKTLLLNQGVEIMPPASPEEARKLVQDDQAFWLPIIKEAGISAE